MTRAFASWRRCAISKSSLLSVATGVTDRGLSHLARLPRLKFLALDGVNVTDAGMANLKELKELTGFRLGSIPITDRGLAELRGLAKVTHFRSWEKPKSRMPAWLR